MRQSRLMVGFECMARQERGLGAGDEPCGRRVHNLKELGLLDLSVAVAVELLEHPLQVVGIELRPEHLNSGAAGTALFMERSHA